MIDVGAVVVRLPLIGGTKPRLQQVALPRLPSPQQTDDFPRPRLRSSSLARKRGSVACPTRVPNGQRTKTRRGEAETARCFHPSSARRPSLNSAVCFVSSEFPKRRSSILHRAARWLFRGLCGTSGPGECSRNIPTHNSWSALLHPHPQLASSAPIHRRSSGSHSRPSTQLEFSHPDSEDIRDRNTFSR